MRRRPFVLLSCAFAAMTAPFLPAPAIGATCESLAALALAQTTITSARTVAAGAFALPPDSPRADTSFFAAFETSRSFCRVQGVVQPSAGSHIEFEVWLPATGWNGKYAGSGNGGHGGSINYFRIAEAVNAGYVGSSTDTGHRGDDPAWMKEHPDQGIDFDYRAIHETADKAKSITRAFYGEGPTRSYFHSCSNGGRQALTEAERYPADYDGLLAGAPSFTYHVGHDADVSDPKLKAFKDRGGKLVLYHGGKDGPTATVKYYRRVVAKLGRKASDEFVRLYLVPEMGHCGGGPVPEFGTRLWPSSADPRHSMILALEEWVEHGVAPDAIVATKYQVDEDPTSPVVRTRPLCPHPQEARWRGKGSTEDAANYTCKPPTPARPRSRR